MTGRQLVDCDIRAIRTQPPTTTIRRSTTHPTPHPQITMSNEMQADLTMTTAQIRRRAIDYDSQVRQGLEDGKIRQVVKALGTHLVSQNFFSLFFFTNILGVSDGAADHSGEGNGRTKGGLPQAPFFVGVHSRVESGPG